MPPIDSTDDLPPFSDALPTEAGTPAVKAAPPVPLPEKIGPYKILGLLGSGGMGVVYRAEQDQPRRPVALKVIKPGVANPEHLHRFRQEAEALARFQHDGIAHVYGAGTIGEGPLAQPYFVMELIDGQALTVYADRHQLSIPQRLRLMIQVCQAVQHAHYQGVVHRDLKPANILVDNDGRPKVLDFGVALFTDTDRLQHTVQTAVGQLIGTLKYMSPEQAEGDPAQIDRRSDIYALGVICYELLTGKLPHDVKGKPILAAARIICEQDPASLSSVNKVFRGDLEAIVSKALARDKAARYQTADGLGADLLRYLEGKPVEARPAGTFSRAWKFARRNKAWVSVAVLLLLAVTGGSWLGALTFLQRERAELAEKEKARLEADGFVQDARLAAQQGRWPKAREKYDQALATAWYRDSIPVRLNRIRALLALNDLDGCLGELEALAAAPDLGEHEGPVLLLFGDLLLGRDNARAEEFIQKAKEKQLPQAQAVYAEALLAKTSPKAVTLLQEALTLDPYYQRARMSLALLLIALARFDEATSQLDAHNILFPADADAIVLRGLLLALQGKWGEAEKVLDQLSQPFTAADRAALHAVAKFLAEFRNSANRPDPVLGLPDLTRQWKELNSQLQLWRPGEIAAGGWNNVLAPLRQLTPFSRLPPRLRQGLERVLKTCADGYNLTFDAAVHIVPEKIVKDVNEAADTHPEGTVVYLQALMRFGAHLWSAADEAVLKAADTPALLPIRRPAFNMAAASEGYLYFLAFQDDNQALQRRAIESLLLAGRPAFHRAAVSHGISPALREALLRQAVHNLREMLALGPHRPLHPDIAVLVAILGKEYNLARQLLDDWEHDAPGHPKILTLRADTELWAGAYGPGFQAADQFLRLQTADACSLLVQGQGCLAIGTGPAPYLCGLAQPMFGLLQRNPDIPKMIATRKVALELLQKQARDLGHDAPAKRSP
jgi:hypothetical protein